MRSDAVTIEEPVIDRLPDQAKAAYYSLQSIDTDTMLALVAATIKRRASSPDQVASLMTIRGDAAKPLIEQRSGPSLSTAEAAVRLSTSDETIRNRIERGRYVAYADTSERRRLRLPQWQFSSPGSVFPWVDTLIRAYGGNGWGLIEFLTVPRSGQIGGKVFNGETFLSELQAGNIQLVLDAAGRANPA